MNCYSAILGWLFAAFFVCEIQAQNEKVLNLQHFDRKWYHFGFSLGVNTGDFGLKHDLNPDDYDTTKTLVGLEVKKQSGFNLGIVSELHFLQPYWSLRFVPALSFSQRNLEYRFLEDGGEVKLRTKPIESTYLVFPLLIKYRSERHNNFAAYILGGANYSLDLASQHKVDNSINVNDEIVVKIKQHSFNAEVGFGFDFFLKYFKFSSEIKYSIGMHDVSIDDNTIFSDPIQSLRPKMLVISLNFEG
ncbi:PorT family protein [Bacteroidales bacterium AH-315-I05]|nr:PorT family protein [Bacteroidales bacterium AH-315-I05]